MTTTTFIM